MDDNSVKAIRAFCLMVALCVMGAVGGCHFTNRVAINKGLCQGSINGQSGYYWVPCASMAAGR